MPRTAPEQIADAIYRLAEEHGVPNAFAPHEIAMWGVYGPMRVGRVLRSERDSVNAILEPLGLTVTDYRAGEEDPRRMYARVALTPEEPA